MSRRQIKQAHEMHVGRSAIWHGPYLRSIGLIALVLCLTSTPSSAIDWEKMVMPGPLAQDHAKYEKDCASCHVPFDAEAQRALCLDCHKEIAADLAADEGFHSRHPLASTGQCRSCHADHRGREADIRGLTEASFDHAQTDYPLAGAHQSTKCESCHLPEVRRREAPVDCIGCHKKDDSHQGKLGEDCAQCHDEFVWTRTRFDHDKTEYPLTGAHKSASCVGCHVGDRYKDTPTECVSCHSIDDAHRGRFGSKCADCHTTEQWKQEGFDHFRKSGFALVGSHARATCATCHREAPGKRKLPESCSGCHASDDIHAGRFGPKCGDCHKPEKWEQVRFDHGKKTKFPLRGKHEKASCESCHSANVEKVKMDSTCIACHGSDDVHNGSLGRNCENCHNEESFSGRVVFDHDLTSFPLLGLHAMSPCESCHSSHRFQREDFTCYACHQPDDKHEGTLGIKCNECHNPNGWNIWRFDHDQQTEFALHGAHQNLECAACHQQPRTLEFQMAQTCINCHSGDDAHRGGFGRDCDDCHTEKAWKPASFGRGRGGRE